MKNKFIIIIISLFISTISYAENLLIEEFLNGDIDRFLEASLATKLNGEGI